MGDSELAEAALVVHVSAAFLALKHCVWPESPFRESKRKRTNHLDLLIDLDPESYENPNVLTVEAKAISPGHEKSKIAEIVRDHGRICDWALLDPEGKPLFFTWSPPEEVRGLLLALITEEYDYSHLSLNHFSQWWEDPTGQLLDIPTAETAKLRSILESAELKGIEPSSYIDGRKYSVGFAIYQCDAATSGENLHDAEHEAAHAIVALRSAFHVEEIFLSASGVLTGGVRTDWKRSRSQYRDDAKLLTHAFAVAYAGAIVDLRNSNRTLQDVLNDLPTDVDSIKDVRQTALDWGLVRSIPETARFSEAGFALTEKILQEDEALVADLAVELLQQHKMDGASLITWYKKRGLRIASGE